MPPAASAHRQVMTALETLCAAINGTGVYHFDFSGSDQVKIGLASTARRMNKPTIYIGIRASSSVTGPELTRWTRTPTFVIEALVPSSADPGEQVLDGLDAMDDIMRAIEADRSLGLQALGVRDVLVGATAFSGQSINVGNYGIASLDVQCTISRTTGG
jgi:hypothetical protein